MSTPYAAERFLPRRLRNPGPSLGKRLRKLTAAEAAYLRLASAGTGVQVELATEHPTLMALAVDDLCWQLGVADHAGRRPAFWRRAERAAWRQEQRIWESERERLAATALAAM
jgi:hypothetical protein